MADQVGIFRFDQPSYTNPSYFLPRQKCRELRDAGKGEFVNGKTFRLYGEKVNQFVTSHDPGEWFKRHISYIPRSKRQTLRRLHISTMQCGA
jgi:hypothetical protein